MAIDTGLTITVSGKAYPVMLEAHPKDFVKATFSLHLGEENDVEAPSFAELAAKVKDLRLVRFELPFTNRIGQDGMVTGFHASNGNMLVRWGSGKTEQVYARSSLNDAMPQLSDEEKDELRKLIDDVRSAQSAWNEFVRARQFESVHDAADEARRLAGGVSA